MPAKPWKRAGLHNEWAMHWRKIAEEAEAKAKLYEDALQKIRSEEGKVCDEFICDHRSCNSSYSAWAIADEALKDKTNAELEA